MPLTRTNRILITAAAMVGVAAGAAGVAGAVTDGDVSEEPAPAVADQSPTADDGREQEICEDGDDGAHDVDDADEGPEPGDAALIEGAAVAQTDAEATARAEVPGTVTRTEIEDDDGTVVWDVEIDGDDGTAHEVTVDATSGDVVAREVAD